MKKIAIVTKQLTMGGCEKALISMLKVFPHQKYKVTLFVMSEGGELFNEVPEYIEVKVIPYISLSAKNIMLNYIKSGKIIDLGKALMNLGMQKLKNYYGQYYHLAKILPRIKEEFDLAISYFAPCEFPDWYTANNIRAKKKAVWIHSDVSKFEGINQPLCIKLYSKFDKIFCVSKESRASFINTFSQLENKVDLFYNIISKEDIISLGDDEGFSDYFEGIRVLTVGRLSKEKGQDLIPNVLARLIKDGYKIRWYCVGEGALRKELEKEIEKYNLSEFLYLLGNKANPYPFFKQCNIYVQPSRYEGYCITLAEARAFNKPIITTDFVGAREQIMNKETGYIIDFSTEELYSKLRYLIENKNIRSIFEKNLSRININTLEEMEKLNDLFS